MGDKSPKSKVRNQNQKSAVKQQNVANAKTKQLSQSKQADVKGKK